MWGLKGSTFAVIYADYYGRKHLGKITAVDAMMGLAGTAVGPLLINASHDHFGSFREVFYVLSALPCVMAVVELLFLKKPGPPPGAVGAGGEHSVYDKAGRP